MSLNCKACTERRRLRRRNRSCLDTPVKPNQYTIDQRQRLGPDPPWLGLPPIRQNASAKILGTRKSAACILISGKPSAPKAYIIVGKQKQVSSEFRHCPIPSGRQPLPIFRDSPDWEPFPKCFHHPRGLIGAVIINHEYFNRVQIDIFLTDKRVQRTAKAFATIICAYTDRNHVKAS